MRTIAIAASLLLAAGVAHADTIPACSAMQASPQPLQATVVAPLAAELRAPRPPLGAPSGVLAEALDESLSVDNVLYRMKVEGCRKLANITPLPSVVDPNDPATYKPRTQYDNTPWRFNMNQNGKQMTADEFDAWMKARGVRVVKARPVVDPVPVAPETSTDTESGQDN